MFISSAFSTGAMLNSLAGGLGIGAVVSIYTAQNSSKMGSSTFNKLTHGGSALATLILSVLLSSSSPMSLNLSKDVLFEAAFSSIPAWRLILAGALTGAGSKLAKGCTSGNGVQGLATMSPASLTFIVIMMGASAVTTVAANTSMLMEPLTSATPFHSTLALLTAGAIGVQYAVGQYTNFQSLANVIAGGAFSLSLVLSSMVRPSKVVGFMDFSNVEHGWDPSLGFVLFPAVGLTTLVYRQLMCEDQDTPKGVACKKNLDAFSSRAIDASLLLGAVMFGTGWGLTGMCPGPGVINGVFFAANGLPNAALWVTSMWTAHISTGKLQSYMSNDKCKTK